MAKRATLTSNGDTWVFEEGKRAVFTDRKGARQTGDFDVIEIHEGTQFLIVSTSLKGLSRYDWAPLIQWAGEYKLESF